jgi:molybdopterin synthase sulfur carrier subunit
MIRVRFFANLREKLGCELINLEYSGEHSAEEVKQKLLARGDQWQALGENDLLVAVNQTICSLGAELNDGDELAFFPPVTGG